VVCCSLASSGLGPRRLRLSSALGFAVMQIVLVLFILAAAVLLTLGAVLVGSLILGGVLLCTKRIRALVPIFFLIVPATILGSLAGGIIIGYFSIRANENLVFLGPVGGLLAGGVAGLLLGVAGALIWWFRIARAAKQPNETLQATAAPPRC
jgi:hypothetical protein